MAKLKRFSPAAIFAFGLIYTLALGLVDYWTPVGMSFTLFYGLGTVFVGWSAGRWPAVLLALISATLVMSHDWTIPSLDEQPAWVGAWNISTRFLLLCAAGWFAAELSRLTRLLASLVEERTAQWKQEAEQHKATSARLAESLDLNQRIFAASAMGIVAYKASGECVFANEAIARIAGGSVEQILAGNFQKLESWKHSGLLRLAEEALAQGRPRSAECCDTTRFGRTAWLDAHMVPFVVNGQPHLLHMSYDITERKTNEARLNSIIQGVPIILFAVNHQGVITFEDGQALTALGFKPGEHLGQTLAEAYSRFPQILNHARRALAGEEFSAEMDAGFASFLCCYSPTRDLHGKLTGFIGVATNITERQRLERQILEISDREQARIGQEIHDGLCQQLVSLAFDANSLEQRLREAGRSETTVARRIVEFLDEAITEARQLSRGLFPVRLEAEGLPSALEELANSTSERFRINCRFESNEGAAVNSKAIATHLYRIAQEAINNSVRHGQASSIQIQLHRAGEQLELRVEDDGTGREVPAPESGKLSGMGLYIMDYRARAIGGTLRLGPSAAGGTTVSCCVPSSRR
jgi:PAS domain S-box-containing protein